MAGPGRRTLLDPPAWLSLSLAVLFVSSSAIITRLAQGGALAIAGWRLTLATGLLLIWGPARRGVRSVARHDVWLTAAAAVFLAIHFGAWIASLQMVPVAVSVVLVSTHPVFVVALRALGGDKPRRFEAAGVVVALAGLAVMTGFDADPAGRSVAGAALAVLGAASLAVYLVIASGLRRRVPTTSFLILVYGTAGTGLLATQAMSGGALAPPRPLDAALYLALAVLPTIGGHGLFAHAVGQVRPVIVSVCFLAEPIVASLLAIPIFGEVPPAPVWVGATVVLVGLALVTLVGRRTPDAGDGQIGR